MLEPPRNALSLPTIYRLALVLRDYGRMAADIFCQQRKQNNFVGPHPHVNIGCADFL